MLELNGVAGKAAIGVSVMTIGYSFSSAAHLRGPAIHADHDAQVIEHGCELAGDKPAEPWRRQNQDQGLQSGALVRLLHRLAIVGMQPQPTAPITIWQWIFERRAEQQAVEEIEAGTAHHQHEAEEDEKLRHQSALRSTGLCFTSLSKSAS